MNSALRATTSTDRIAAIVDGFKQRLERFSRPQPLVGAIETGAEVVARLRPIAVRFITERAWTNLLLLCSSAYRDEAIRALVPFMTPAERRIVRTFFRNTGRTQANG